MDGTDGESFLRDCVRNCVTSLKAQGFYKCELCRMKLPLKSILTHIKSERKHQTKFNAFKEDIITFSLPEPGESQILAIDEMAERYAKRLLTPDQIALRFRAVEVIEQTINEWFPHINIKLRLYGSTVSGFALDTSDVNVELMVDNEDEYNPGQALQKVAMLMKQQPDTYSEIHTEFDISNPRLSFHFNSPYLDCESLTIHFGVYSGSSYEVAEILAKYCSLDSRVAKLAACFKIWAQNCGYDRADHGFWPSHAFQIMVIHFLQSTSPPVLPSIFPSDGTMPSKMELEEKYHYLKKTWTTANNKRIGHLWLELLAYYAKDFSIDNNVVNIRGLNLTLSSKEWSSRILAVEDPVHKSHNLSRSIGRKELYFNYHHNLVRTYSYFMTPRTRNLSMLVNLDDFVMEIGSLNSRNRLNNCEENDDEEKQLDDECENDEPRDVTKTSGNELYFSYHVKLSRKFGITFRLRHNHDWKLLSPNDFWYTLEITKYPFYRAPSPYCIKCKRIDHYKSACLAEKLPELIDVPDVLIDKKAVHLNEVCHDLYFSNRLDPNYEHLHQEVLMSLTELVRKSFSNARLQLFGSSKNGFGAKKCDLDLCMTFEDNETGKNIDQTAVIEKLAKDLRQHRKQISNLQPIPQAKVPVLKLRFTLNKRLEETFDCDISLYNLLASHNTQLLRTYCQIDERVAMLGFTVKHFFKQCGICDASKGSLSSYAYTLMTLYYLQRCNPPIIPFLQELGEPQKRTVDGWNTWFFDDLDRLSKEWPYYNKNRLSIGNLFYGFLKFYSEIFPFDALVVCIRQSSDLTKTKKKWTGRRIAIEDPFLLSHNLGQGIDLEMARYIKASIILGRNRIGNQPESLLSTNYPTWNEYFFDSKFLIDGPQPKGRGCHNCNRIGHQRTDCPEKPQNRGRNRNDIDRSRGGPRNWVQGNRRVGEVGAFSLKADSHLSSPPRQNKKSLIGNVRKQVKHLTLSQRDQSQRDQDLHQEVPSSSSTGNINNNKISPLSQHRNDRYSGTNFNYHSHQHQHHQYHHHQQQQHQHHQPQQQHNVPIPPPWRSSNNNNSSKNNDHHYHNHSDNNSKHNLTQNINHHHPHSPSYSGSGNRLANMRFGGQRQFGQPTEYIYRSPEFPDLTANKPESNRRR